MESLPQDILVTIAEKAAEDSAAATLQNLRLVDKRFHAAVHQAAFAMRLTSSLTRKELEEIVILFPNAKPFDLGGCCQLRLSPQDLFNIQPVLSGLHTLGSCLEGGSAAQLAQLFPQLRTLSLSECDAMSEDISQLGLLEKLSLMDCPELEELPNEIGGLSNLLVLNLWRLPLLRRLPEGISGLISLRQFTVDQCTCLGIDSQGNPVLAIPSDIWMLSSLEELTLRDCINLRVLPMGMSWLSSLKRLNLEGCSNLYHLPNGISRLKFLTSLELKNCGSLGALPDSLSRLTALRNLDLTRYEPIICLLLPYPSPGNLAQVTKFSFLPMSVTFPLFTPYLLNHQP